MREYVGAANLRSSCPIVATIGDRMGAAGVRSGDPFQFKAEHFNPFFNRSSSWIQILEISLR